MLKLKVLIILLVSLSQAEFFCQEESEMSNSSLLILRRGANLGNKRKPGELITETESEVKFIALDSKDTLSVSQKFVKKIYYSDEIYLFERKKFQYKNAYLFNFSWGISGNHGSLQTSFTKRFPSHLELGIGTAFNSTGFDLPVAGGEPIFVSVPGLPIYGVVKYHINEGKRLYYVKGKIGLANNLKPFNADEISNGYMWEAGVGFQLGGGRKVRHYFELSQFSSYANGHLAIASLNNAPADITFKRTFYRIVFTYGIELGKK